ncbi:uncharacterized protein BCR38DRAFT_415789 [Pseudomassariella vexata]|uniref:Mg2+ transporter protein, CorA-like/Zinc transport protein ZntB n=1 Tax=Pseudomassariella vexata TaxID=1141098 RepID=A0A1Y2EHK2_9PEZI|nr:uncharacterized protein BCR38DRAFT_415789 [Pseudomassariella vexata]ORY71048.1 hypothetical protein BCR38DRAFT_415789 [Pseudomassariella vexata]
MDELLFQEYLRGSESIPEAMSYLEILNYSGSTRMELLANLGFSTHHQALNAHTFDPTVISFSKEAYESLVREMNLPYRAIETSTVVGPFFWWTIVEKADGAYLQFIFRKSDARWKGNSRGWEMILSYSFNTRITSGYLKGTDSVEIETILRRLKACAQPTSHALLLPILVLGHEMSAKNDNTQRKIREQIRRLEDVLSGRYKVEAAAGYASDQDLTLDAINHDMVESHSQAMWKRPQAWQNVVTRLSKATDYYWEQLPEEEKTPELEGLHKVLLSRLDFVTAKLEGLKHYADVSLERLKLQREVMHGIINQRESRLSAAIAMEQHRLAGASRRDSVSMKTLTLMGSIFLPGTFLSSIFSMTFFDFGNDGRRRIPHLWIYFVIAVPLTALIVGAWWMYDKRPDNGVDEDVNEAEKYLDRLEAQIMEGIRTKTGARVRTGLVDNSHIRRSINV